MPDPLDSNDDWAELARELERDKPASPTPAETPIDPSPVDAQADNADATADEAGALPGSGRKRRRRRRRRKGGATGDTVPDLALAGEDASDAEEMPDTETIAPSEDFDTTTSEDAEEFEPASVASAGEEDTGSDVLRELIATWNVPSWDSIVSGLHRPH